MEPGLIAYWAATDSNRCTLPSACHSANIGTSSALQILLTSCFCGRTARIALQLLPNPVFALKVNRRLHLDTKICIPKLIHDECYNCYKVNHVPKVCRPKSDSKYAPFDA